MTNIIVAFPGTGKSTALELAGEDRDQLVDLELDEFEGDYEAIHSRIKELVAERKYKAILITSEDEDLLKYLVEKKTKIILVYPGRRLKDAFMKRYEESGKDKDYIQAKSDDWEGHLDRFSKFSKRHFRYVASIELRDPSEGVWEVLTELRIF